LPTLDAETLAQAQLIWDYHQLNHTLQTADVIMVLGSHDTRVAERGATLLMEGFAPYLLFSGGLGRLTEGNWTKPEADKFARIAREMGVPEHQILIENQSTNTGENIRFSYQVLQEKQIAVQKLVLVQKPYMERRTFATFQKQWPGPPVEYQVTSPLLNFQEYPNAEVPQEEVIQIMAGDLHRIKIYGHNGFQAPQEIPEQVWAAFESLSQKGFTKYLLPESET
jgi:uncharacterized SAM-binding protein YcdF (DUF218 family)